MRRSVHSKASTLKPPNTRNGPSRDTLRIAVLSDIEDGDGAAWSVGYIRTQLLLLPTRHPSATWAVRAARHALAGPKRIVARLTTHVTRT